MLNIFNTKKYHVFAPMGRFQLESIYLYFPPSSGTTVENKGKLILSLIMSTFLIRPATSQSSSYPVVLTRLGGPSSTSNPHLKM